MLSLSLLLVLPAWVIALTLHICTSIYISFFVFIVLNSNYFSCFQTYFKPISCVLEPKNFLRALRPLEPLLRSQNIPPSLGPQTPQLGWYSLRSLFHGLYSLLGSYLIVAYRALDSRKPATQGFFWKKQANLFKEWMKKFVALLTKVKQPKMNRKMTPAFFQLYFFFYIFITTF